ncbi:bifunctional PGK/TIM [bacterium BMS3Abin04]|nr:bifunctional PGK/TIM [bacterium BMS3Abin04]
MRTKVIAGNWKMNKDLNESVTLVSEIKNGLTKLNSSSEIIICPPYTSLETVNSLIKDTAINLGAQNMHFEDSGAFTGEISADMLKSVGCNYVILGHSERRKIFLETNEVINKKVKKALDKNLKVIFCIGETLSERESNVTFKVLEEQIVNGLSNIDNDKVQNLTVAYEPVWAIGTGKTASPEQAQEVHEFIRKLIAQLYSDNLAQDMKILYGGSVKPNNAASLLSKPDIDGALIGGACLKPDLFLEVIKIAG